MPYIPDSVFESKAWEKLSPHSKLVYLPNLTTRVDSNTY